MAIKYRCGACGNLTRFDVWITRRMREFRHFQVNGVLLNIEENEVEFEEIERIQCRWCQAEGDKIELVEIDESSPAPE